MVKQIYILLMKDQKPRILLLSDLWGYRRDQWVSIFEQALSAQYQIHFLDSTKIAGINEDTQGQESLHQKFIKGGIDKAVQYLIEQKEEYAIIIGISIGGTIAWQALLSGLSAKHLIGISATRLRYEKRKPNCLVDLYFGEEDPFRPDTTWFNKLQLQSTLFAGEGHHIYTKPKIVQQILNDL